MRRTIPVGWPRTPVRMSIRQGSTGTVRVTLSIYGDDGNPLPSYDGFAALVALSRGDNRTPLITIEPTVTPLPDESAIVVDLVFAPSDTATVTDGELVGDLLLIGPDSSRNYPLDIRLTVERRHAR